jgi:hypothetical protein
MVQRKSEVLVDSRHDSSQGVAHLGLLFLGRQVDDRARALQA